MTFPAEIRVSKGGSQLSSLQLAQNRLGFVQLSIQKPETAFCRIEYDVAAEAACQRFWQLWQELGLFPDYIANFVKQAVYHPKRFYECLGKNSLAKLNNILQMVVAAKKLATTANELAELMDLEQKLQNFAGRKA